MSARPTESAPLFVLCALAFAACGDPRPGPSGAGAPSSAGATFAGTTSGPPSTSGAGASTAAPSGDAKDAGAPAERCPAGMVLVPGGTFRMGSAADDKDADPDEKPAHDVTLKPYCLGRTEVTVAEYERCAGEPRDGGKCSPASTIVVSQGLSPSDVIFWSKFCNAGHADRKDHPINCVDFRQAETYCRWAGGRLPTEAEWERAARGDDGRKYPWGNEPPSEARLNACGAECARSGAALGRKDKKTMFAGDDGAETTAPAGRYPAGASVYGILDLAGNVWEWTADTYAPYAPSRTNDLSHEGRASRAVRGGHWLNANPGSPRAANRESRPEEKRLEDVGFRCAAEVARD